MNNDSIKKLFLLAAITYAKSGNHVWYISCFPFEKIPNNIIIPEKEVLSLITFVFLKDYKDLINHLNGIHLWRKPPRIILVAGFEEYSNLNKPDYNPMCAALISTSLLDAISTAAAKLNAVSYLIVACRILENYKSRLNILRMLYFSEIISHPKEQDMLNAIMKTLEIR
ncbi:hypothetical protein HHI36_020924 [Cryptolaemus montrouzieri]|uniref:Uncharacterized protein n=1 Tax=Cryptolaemus montrouzieri TaxID=559131 RepID=A0ABD2NDF0_9CUCU